MISSVSSSITQSFGPVALLWLIVTTSCGGDQTHVRGAKQAESKSQHDAAPENMSDSSPSTEEPPCEFVSFSEIPVRLDKSRGKRIRLPLRCVRVRAPVIESYDRRDWKHWIDADGDCQDIRQEVLIEESEVPVTFKTERACEVATGRWTCPYTGEVFTDPGKLDVAHLVPLAEANRSGGHAWDSERREAYANSLGLVHHLVVVKASANRSKGNKGPAQWLPPNSDYRCDYLRNWIDIKAHWMLTTTEEEKAVLEDAERPPCSRFPPRELASPECRNSPDPLCGL